MKATLTIFWILAEVAGLWPTLPRATPAPAAARLLPPGSAGTVTDLWDRLAAWAPPWVLRGAVALAVLWLVLRITVGIRRRLRRRRPPAIHPRLARYNVDHVELDRQRRALAGRILATSTGATLAGYRIVRQVEAVFVEGCRTPEDALVALKAEAAERGANALVNVGTQRTPAGRCTACGDAVVAVPDNPDAADRPGGSAITRPAEGS